MQDDRYYREDQRERGAEAVVVATDQVMVAGRGLRRVAAIVVMGKVAVLVM